MQEVLPETSEVGEVEVTRNESPPSGLAVARAAAQRALPLALTACVLLPATCGAMEAAGTSPEQGMDERQALFFLLKAEAQLDDGRLPHVAVGLARLWQPQYQSAIRKRSLDVADRLAERAPITMEPLAALQGEWEQEFLGLVLLGVHFTRTEIPSIRRLADRVLANRGIHSSGTRRAILSNALRVKYECDADGMAYLRNRLLRAASSPTFALMCIRRIGRQAQVLAPIVGLLLEHRESEVRYSAAMTLANIGIPRSLDVKPRLLAGMKNAADSIEQSAFIVALSCLFSSDQDALAAVAAGLGGPETTVETLRAVRRFGPLAAPYADRLERLTFHKRSSVAGAAILALAETRVGGEVFLHRLLRCVDTDSVLAPDCAKALVILQERSGQVIDVLRRGCMSPSPRTQRACKDALNDLKPTINQPLGHTAPPER